MSTGLLPRVQELESELGNVKSRCSQLEAECQGLREKVRLLEELRVQFAELAARCPARAAGLETTADELPTSSGGRKAKGVCFRDRNSVCEIEAASDSRRSVKNRVPTTFAPAVTQAQGLRFAEDQDVEEVEAEVGSAGGAQLRPIKSRQATCFASGQAQEADEEPTAREKRVGFSNSEATVEEVEGASIARSAKKRVPTTSVKPGSLRAAGGAGLDDDADGEEIGPDSGSASTGEAAGAELRPTKSRQATCFAPRRTEEEEGAEEETGEEQSPKPRRCVGFRNHDSIVEIAGNAGNLRPVKKRQATAFVQQGDVPKHDQGSCGDAGKPSGVSFAGPHETQEIEPDAGGATAEMRPAKSRQATCFASRLSPEDEDEEVNDDGATPKRRTVGFQDPDPGVEASGGGARSPKKRAPTAFVHVAPAAEQTGGVRFMNGSDVHGEVTAETANSRSVRLRQALENKEEEVEDEAEVEIKYGNTMRPSRVRQATAFAPPPQDAGEEDNDEDVDEEQESGPVAWKDRGVLFSEEVVEMGTSGVQAADMRSSRARVPTAFVPKSNLSSVSFGSVDIDSDEEPETPAGSTRSTRARLPTTFARAKALDYTESVAGSEGERESPDDDIDGPEGEGEEKQAHEGAVEVDRPCNPDVEAHRTPGAPKDNGLIKGALAPLYFFRDLDDQGITALIAVMDVFDFADGEDLTVQGNTKGGHFFIVAEGTVQILRDSKCKAEISMGKAFGESVILLSGAQNATARAVGPVRVYGVTGHDIRRTLRNRYQKGQKEASKLISDLLSGGTCSLLHKLSAYQTQCLYDKAKISSLVCGDFVMREGEPANAVHVHVEGTLCASVAGAGLRPPEKWAVIGEMGLLFRHADATVQAREPTQMLTLTREVLKDMFGETLEEELLKSCLLGKLARNPLFAALNMEQLDVVAGMGHLVDVLPGSQIEREGLCFAMCIHGTVEAEAKPPGVGGPQRDGKCRLAGLLADTVGGESVALTGAPAWSLRVQTASGFKDNAKVVVWPAGGLSEFLQQKSRLEASPGISDGGPSRPSFKKMVSMGLAVLQDDKEAALRRVVVLRSLSAEQLRRLAESMEVLHAQAGSAVFIQGEAGDGFYIIHSGQLSVRIGGRHVRTLGIGDYVGERALLFSEPRSATVEVEEDAELWKMNKESFMEVVKGPILDYMKDRIAIQSTRVDLDTLVCLRVVGRGGFGVVKMVQSPDTKTRYALKCVNKRQAVAQKQQKALANERNILAELDHPFVIKFVRSFLGKHFVYFLMELVTGGELLDALDSLGLLKKPQAQFYVASMALALEFLHERRIAYLDVKGENCLIDQHGYIKIIDFGIAERLSGGRIYAVKGTPLFMAPEVILGKGYACSADLWSLGICMHDFLLGRFPFGNDKATNPEIFKAVLRAPLKVPKQLEREADTKSLLTGFLTRDPQKRLGAGPQGYAEIKEHPYFTGFSWESLLSRQLDPPFIPTCEMYAENQEAGSDGDASNPRMTCKDGHVQGVAEDGVEDADDWVDPDPSWQVHF